MTARIHKIIPNDVSRPFSPGIDCSPLYHSGVKKWLARIMGVAFGSRFRGFATEPRRRVSAFGFNR